MKIYLDSVEFSDFATSGWVFENLVDWFGLTDDKSPNDERPQGHGSFPVGSSLRSSRAVSFKASYLGVSAAEVEEAVSVLSSVGAEAPVLMRVDDNNRSTWRWVTVASAGFEDNFQASEGVVNVDVIARDPRRYADAAFARTGPPTAGAGETWPVIWPMVWPGGGTNGRIAIVNSGRAPSSPTFRLGGGFDSAVVTCIETGDRLGIGRVIPSGALVEIDSINRRALYDGDPDADISRWLQFREWADVPGGATRTYQLDVTNPIGSPYLDGRVFPAWW